MLEQLYTSTKTITVYAVNPHHLAYIRSWDAMVLFNYQALDKVFRDGSQANMGVANYLMTMGNRVGGRHFWAYWHSPQGWIFLGADEISGQYHLDDWLNPDWQPAIGLFRAGDYLDDLAGLLLHSKTSGIIEIYRLADGVKLGEIQDPGGPYYDNLAYAGPGRIAAFHHSTGKLAICQYLGQYQVIFKSAISPCWRTAFDCLHGLVVSLQSDKKVRIYHLTPVPASLSNPAFVPPGDQHRLTGSKVQTRLTGADGEACPGWWVHWELLGLPPKGFLEKKALSKTDEDGWAENYYFGPAAETGQETVKVRVVV